jgi:hypothetical protein
MEHTLIVTPADLESYAATQLSERVMPEMVNMLVKETARDLTECRIPYGDEVNQPGWDGLVVTEAGGKQFVPKKKSYWEIGTGGKPQNKATSDFKKRTAEMNPAERLESVFVFATPHSTWTEPQQRKWIKKRENEGWLDIKILDGVRIADWLREYPAIGLWLLKAMNITRSITGFTTPAQHWENLEKLARGGDPPLPAKTFTAGRDQACKELHRLFEGQIKQLPISLESMEDANDFVAAFLATLEADTKRTYANRCLFISDRDTWLTMANLKSAHVLVAHPNLDLDSTGEQLLMTARKNNHAVVIPVSGAWAGSSESIIPLRSPSAATLETALVDAGYTLDRARELASVGASSLSALKRNLLGLVGLAPYATWENARYLAQAGLMGRWDGGNPADRAALEEMLGKGYGEWIEIVRPETLRSDTPLIQRDEKWKMISRGEAWSALGPQITDADLAGFHKAALRVFGERDPKLALPKDERFAASVSGKVLKHSSALREGMAETLALLGSRGTALSNCSEGKAEGVAILTVRALLKDADWVVWAGLNSHLPMFAEAAPEEFLHAVETALLSPSESPFNGVYAQEGSAVMGWNYMTGLLWALETIAWDPENLVRVSVILADLAAIDPGGNWSNRPANSLVDILLPWHPQTYAAIVKRKAAAEAVLREQPNAGWKLLLSLLPSSHGSTSGTRKPVWRNYPHSDWSPTVSMKDYGEQVIGYANMAVSIAASDLSKLATLIDRLPNLPQQAHDRILEHLSSQAVVGLAETNRMPLWEALADLVGRHRKFADAQWAMPVEAVAKIDEVAAKIAPVSPGMLHRRLFSGREFDSFDGGGDYKEQTERLEQRRRGAVKAIFESEGIAGVMKFARQVASPEKAGHALGCLDLAGVDVDVLPGSLGSSDKAVSAFVGGFLWGRFWTKRLPWVDSLPLITWTVDQKIEFFAALPFSEETWSRAEQILGEDASKYWSKANVNPYGAREHLIEAAEKLLAVGRPRAALMCLHTLVYEKKDFPPNLAIQALKGCVKTEELSGQVDRYNSLDVIKWLQNNKQTDANDLFGIEWAYLPILDHEFGGTPKALEERMATDPAFFCEVIGLIYRSKKAKGSLPEPTEEERSIAQNAYRLLKAWKTVPGKNVDGTLDGQRFSQWLAEAKVKTAESGHLNIAMSEIGQMLPYAPKDSDLWIARPVAEALNAKDAEKLRSGFTTELFNIRGVFTFTSGAAEKQLAREYKEKAEALEQKGYHRFAASIKQLAKSYERDAAREAKRDPFED